MNDENPNDIATPSPLFYLTVEAGAARDLFSEKRTSNPLKQKGFRR
jgi:CRISPR/Cas system CMR subunit Cmr6 (Cas7 group RAMP superfamily)